MKCFFKQPSKFWVTLFSSCLLSACVILPIPSADRASPQISGVILKNGVPVFPASIELNANNGKLYRTKTTKDGSFKFKAKRQFSPVTLMFGDRIFVGSLTLQSNGDPVTLYTYGPMYTLPDEMKVKCDLAQSIPPCTNS